MKIARVPAVIILLIFCFGPIDAIHAETVDTSWKDLSDKDMSPEGRAALSLKKEDWKHAESAHFIYHFIDKKESDAVFSQTEAYYNWIKDFFGIKEDKWRKKSHVFIFTDGVLWDDLMARLGKPIERRSFTNGWELFIFRAPIWIAPRYALGHELTHLIVFRFMEGPVPLFLNEGFSSFATSQLVKMQLEMDRYEAPYINPVNASEYIPLEEMVKMSDYPAGREEAFYRESEWFVRFLVLQYGKEKFYIFMRAVAGGEKVVKAVERTYGENVDIIEKRFRRYATEGK